MIGQACLRPQSLRTASQPVRAPTTASNASPAVQYQMTMGSSNTRMLHSCVESQWTTTTDMATERPQIGRGDREDARINSVANEAGNGNRNREDGDEDRQRYSLSIECPVKVIVNGAHRGRMPRTQATTWEAETRNRRPSIRKRIWSNTIRQGRSVANAKTYSVLVRDLAGICRSR